MVRASHFVVAIAFAALVQNAHGQANWVANTAYSAPQAVRASDGNVYRAIANGTNFNPILDGGGHWVLDHVCVSTTLPINSTARFTTLGQAAAFTANARIASNAILTIQVAAGYTSHEIAPVIFSNSDGVRINIVGGTGSTINFATNNLLGGLTIDDGTSIGAITGLTIVGKAVNASNYATYGNIRGIKVSPGATLRVQQLTINGFDFGIVVDGGSLYGADLGGLVISGVGDQGLLVTNNGRAIVPFTQISNVSNLAPGGMGFGFAASQGGMISCPKSNVAGATIAYYAIGGASIYAYQTTASTISNPVYFPSINVTGNFKAIIYDPWQYGQ